MAAAPASVIGGRVIARRAVILVLLSIAAYYAIWGGEYSAFDLRRLRQQQEVERQRLEIGRVQVDSMRDLVTKLENDPAAIEAVARERFGLIRPGEVLYRFVEVDSVPVPDSAGSP